jgi:hypothetical protein
MKAILRRLRRVEQNLVPQPTPPDLRQIEIVEQIQERFRRHCEAEGKPYHESLPLLPPDYNGPRLGIAETILAYPRTPDQTGTSCEGAENRPGCAIRADGRPFMRSLLTRLKRLEDVRAGEQRHRPLQLEFGYLKKLPPEYTGPRHTATVGRLANGYFKWEERPGLPPPGQDDLGDGNTIRINFVQSKHGRPLAIENFDELESPN